MVNCSSATNRGFRGFQPVELVAMILGFVFFWPIGLAVLVFKLCGGQLPRFAGAEWLDFLGMAGLVRLARFQRGFRGL